MRTLVHLSDLHFGRLDRHLLPPLVAAIDRIAPHLVVVSGDFTQRALRGQFVEARAFLDSLPFPQLLVPGNHDVPLYNVAARFFAPLAAYQRHIAKDLEPMFVDDEIVAAGLNTTRSLVTGGQGRLGESQVRRLLARLRPLPPHLIKIIVTHHPFDLPEGYGADHLVGRARMAMEHLAGAGADLFLAGHLHVSHIGHTAERYKIEGHSALVLQAGTMSTRGRGELNTFNVLRIERPEVTVERHSWSPVRQEFARAWTGTFRHSATGWT